MSHRPNQPVLASRPPGHAPVRSGLPAPLLCGRHVPSVGLPRPACPGPYGSPRPPSAPQSARMCPSRPVRCVPGPAPARLQTAPPCPTAPVVPPRLRDAPARTAGRRTVVVPDARRGRSHTTGCGPALLRPPRRSGAHRGDRPQARASVLPRAPAPGTLRRQPADGHVRPGQGRPGPGSGKAPGPISKPEDGGPPGPRPAGLFEKKHAIVRPLTARAGPSCPLAQYTDKLQKVFTAYLLLFCKNKLYPLKNISRYKVSAKLHINC